MDNFVNNIADKINISDTVDNIADKINISDTVDNIADKINISDTVDNIADKMKDTFNITNIGAQYLISPDIIKSLLLLILAVGGNFIAQTLSCKTQKILTENMIVKHLITIFILYFAIGFVNSNTSEHPLIIIRKTVGIYILFLLFTKMDINFTIIVFILFIISYGLISFIDYYNAQNTPEDSKIAKTLINIQQVLTIIIIIITIIGFIIYFKRKYTEYSNNWSTIKFIFGVLKCKSN
jgi:hypothetical protein